MAINYKDIFREIWQLKVDVSILKKKLEYTTEELENPDSVINKNRFPGMQVWDSTVNKPKWSSGWEPSDPWITWS